MTFRQLELMSVGVADPRAVAHAVGALLEWPDECNTFFFEDAAELAQVAGVDADVNIRRRIVAEGLSAGPAKRAQKTLLLLRLQPQPEPAAHSKPSARQTPPTQPQSQKLLTQGPYPPTCRKTKTKTPQNTKRAKCKYR